MPLMVPLLQWIAKQHPGLRVHAEAAASARLLPLLEARELDVVFGGHATDDHSAYVVELILETPSVFVASPSHPLAHEREISLARLAQFKFGGSQSPRSRNAKLMGFEGENLGWYTASHYEIVLPVVLSGDAVLLTPAFVAQPYLRAGELVILDVNWGNTSQFHFVTTRAAAFSPIVAEIREYARMIGNQLRDDWQDVASQFTSR
jgi:DNA-binding transcriptional LysR family regulator